MNYTDQLVANRRLDRTNSVEAMTLHGALDSGGLFLPGIYVTGSNKSTSAIQRKECDFAAWILKLTIET